MKALTTEKAANKKRAAILDAGLALILKHGIQRISVEEICREAGVSKMTFYKHFANKKDMVEALLKNVFQKMESRIEAIRKSDLSYGEKIKAYIRLKIDQSLPMSWNFIKELQRGSNIEWLNKMKSWNEKILRMFLDDLKEKQTSGEIRPNVSPETFLYISERMIEWASDEHFLGRFVTVEAMATEMMNFLFYGFLGAGEEKRP